MKNIELIRQRVAAIQQREFVRLRAWLSMMGENNEVIARMEGRDGEHRLARIVECVMAELGHQTKVPADRRGSRARRAVSGRG
jgi:hypothetical protein